GSLNVSAEQRRSKRVTTSQHPREKLSTERRQERSRAEEQNRSDDEAVRSGEAHHKAHQFRLRRTGAENADGGSRHDRIHQQEASEKHPQAEKSASKPAEIRSKKEKHQLARGFGAESVNHTDAEHGFAAVSLGIAHGFLRRGGIENP